MLGYLDEEMFNLINCRILLGEDIISRVVENLEPLFSLLAATHHDGLVLSKHADEPGNLRFPEMEVR